MEVEQESREASPTPTVSWSQLVHHCRQVKQEARSYMAPPFSKLTFIETPCGPKLFALGTPVGQTNQTLLSTEIRDQFGTPLYMSSVLDPERIRAAPSTPNQELALLCERQRASVVTGVTDYSVNPASRDFLITATDHLMKFSDHSRVLSPTEASSVNRDSSALVSDAQCCPSDPSIISFVLKKQIHIETDTGIIYSTSSESDEISNGVPPFITQEEMDRFTSVWWSPTESRLLYERVNESKVGCLQFACPGKPPIPSKQQMRYPLAGEANATSELRLLVIENKKVRDVGMRTPLKQLYPWMEYIARAGFLNDGRTVWVQIFNRVQDRAAIILIPEFEFEGFEASSLEPCLSGVTTFHEEVSDVWINTTNSIIPLGPYGINSWPLRFIVASESIDSTLCHLYLLSMENRNGEITRYSRAITSGQFSVCKATTSYVDPKRELVYFIANMTGPCELNLCVASYSESDSHRQCKPLTPSNVSVRCERSFHDLALLPDVGFVVWVSGLRAPQACHFYKFVYTNGDIPSVELAATISVVGASIPKHVSSEYGKILSYQSRNSGERHHALLVFPPGFDSKKTYPVVQYVYGGPGIQLVKNEYTSWVSFQKYSRLGYIVLIIDGRGSANRGTHFERDIKNNMGGPEVEDQIEGLMEIEKMTRGVLDLSRVSVTGWSYGGFMAISMLAKYPNIYKAAVAGGAVTDWHFYDTAYTERYLGLPVGNTYDSCSVLKLVEKLPDEPGRLLIIHGLLDENVHFRHTEALLERLIQFSKPYQLQLYPNERHGIRAADASLHLDTTILHFIQQALIKRPDPPTPPSPAPLAPRSIPLPEFDDDFEVNDENDPERARLIPHRNF